MATEAQVVAWLEIGRAYCPRCDVIRVVVKTAGVSELRCPRCDTLTIETCGDERRMDKG